MKDLRWSLTGVLSDVLSNLSAGWFALLLIEPRIDPTVDNKRLIMRFISGMLTLLVALLFRRIEKSYERFYSSS